MTESARSRVIPTWLIAGFAAVGLFIGARQVRLAVHVWPRWRAGAAEAYPHEHLGLLLGAVTGMLLALALPLPLALTRAASWHRPRRYAVWGVWAVLMAGVAVLLWWQDQLTR